MGFYWDSIGFLLVFIEILLGFDGFYWDFTESLHDSYLSSIMRFNDYRDFNEHRVFHDYQWGLEWKLLRI